jgi:flagellar P-ring protein FlgI
MRIGSCTAVGRRPRHLAGGVSSWQRATRATALQLFVALLLVGAMTRAAWAQSTRVGDLTVRAGDVPRRLVGYGLVVGLDGTGDRSYGGYTNQTPTVQSIVNLLEHFGVRVPTDEMQPRNVAAVAVTAEASPYLHAGGRFEVQVSSLGDASSLRGGVLWITPLVTDPNEPPVATAQGALLVTTDDDSRGMNRRANTARVPEGGVLEVELPAPAPSAPPRLLLRDPDLETATRIAAAVNTAFGPGTAAPEDPGAIALKVPAARADSLLQFLAAVDTLPVAWASPARIVIDARDGTVVTGGQVQVGPASVSHDGLTVQIGGAPTTPAAPAAQAPAAGGNTEAPPPAVLALNVGATVEDIAAGLHAAGATAPEIAAIFDGLRAVQALRAEVIVR